MMYSKTLALALLALGLMVSGCNNDKKDGDPKAAGAVNLQFSWEAKSSPLAASQIRIYNQYNEVLAGAQVLIGNAQGTPFANNFLTADKNGIVVVPSAWKVAAPITVQAPGYIRQTIMDQKPGNISIRLNSAYLTNRAEVRGSVTNLPVVNGDKLIDFALMMPALSKAALLNFDMNEVISPYTDVLSAAGQKSDVPSNLSLPKQKENYIIGITLDKPIYRLKVPTLGPKKFVSVRGRFVFSSVVKELQNKKPFFDLINYFSIQGGTLRSATLTSDLTLLDLPGNELEFNSQIQVNPVPVLADEVLMVIAASDVAGAMVPTDIKRTAAGKVTTLQSMTGKPVYVVSVIKKQADLSSTAPGADRMSAALQPYAATKANQAMLPLIGNPSVINSGNYVITMPALPTTLGINAIATTASISDLVESKDGAKTIIITNKKWEISSPGWNQQLSLPKWPLDRANARQRIEVNYIGSTTSKSTDLTDTALIENATHVTHASTDL